MLMKKSVIVLILPTSSQPRFHKRILHYQNFLRSLFFILEGLYEENIFEKI